MDCYGLLEYTAPYQGPRNIEWSGSASMLRTLILHAQSRTLALTFCTTRDHMVAMWYDQTFVDDFGTSQHCMDCTNWPVITWNLLG